MKTKTKKILAVTTLAFLAVLVLGAGAQAQVTDESVVTATVSPVLTISDASDVAMGTITGTGTVSGSTTWNVKTNSTTGWTLTVAADGPLTTGSDSFPNYPATTPEAWTVGATESAFGFTASGTYANAAFAGGYRGFVGTSAVEIASDDTTTGATTGADTTVTFQATVGSDSVQEAGSYSTTITATAAVI